MKRLEMIKRLNGMLLSEMPVYCESAKHFSNDVQEQRKLLRSLMNVRPPKKLTPEFIKLQDELLSAERDEKGVVDIAEIHETQPNIKLWRGDITRLNAGAVVNAANSRMLGCFCPCHTCIDNAIHSAAGLQLREECAEIMRRQGYDEPAGRAKITRAYNLPSRYVIHTVGPIISNRLTDEECRLLKSCYRSCLELAVQNHCNSIAFCCISTGEFHFPNEKAAEIAIQTVKEYLKDNEIKVIFDVFEKKDEDIYKRLLG